MIASFIRELAECFEKKFFFEKDDLKESFKKNVYEQYKLIPFNGKDLDDDFINFKKNMMESVICLKITLKKVKKNEEIQEEIVFK